MSESVSVSVNKAQDFPGACTRTLQRTHAFSPDFAAVRALNVQEEHSILVGLLISFIMVVYENNLFSSLALDRNSCSTCCLGENCFDRTLDRIFLLNLQKSVKLRQFTLSAECNRALNVRSLHHVHVE